ncbi:hypothetical protein SporoP37_00185 [Sporosarcina sp. P37]|uniref:hypothetical protein n=1 Tax=unclassified Sporosarcina TaxID=2647733 RepID=UPI000A17CCDD|nr:MULTISPECIES: hypothetical protein [unclassified Sporosarcina]ARK23259.1 hypothetical protein SporoP37_00185 [Sporosarcina sp. P37]PID19510.1 hypothetical protein CSV62_03135 [Sporosarcina sp. P35]
MSKTKMHSITVYAFQIGTPVVNIDNSTIIDNYYDSDFFEEFLRLVIESDASKHLDGTNYFHLVSLQQSSDAEILEGKIHTTKYGTLSEIIDTHTDAIVNTLEPRQGVKNEINFVINRESGLFLIQNDPFRIFSRNFFFDFLKNRDYLAEDLVTEFNEKNSAHSLYKEHIFTLLTIHDQGFYEQLAKIQNIKSVSVNTIVEKADVNSALSHFTKNDASKEDYLNNVTEMTYTFKNTIRSNGISQVKKFVQNALDLEKIDSILAKGRAEGKDLKAEFKIKPQSYPIKTTKNSNGILDQSKIITQMVDLAKSIKRR